VKQEENVLVKKTSLAYNYNLLAHSLKRTSLINDLGICFDSKLKFNDHINKIKIKQLSD
jgi:hypothetical protein